MSRDVFFLIASGAMRNLGFGFYNIVFAIYLSKLGFDTVTIGAVITISSISGVLQILVGSILMDRYSRKRVMIGFGLLTFFGSGVMALSSDPLLVVIMSGLGLIGARAGGSGAGGMGGPVMVGQVAMLADRSTDRERNFIFGVNAFVLHGSGSIGALLASLPDILQGYAMEEFASYRVLFAIGALMSLLYIGLLFGYRERRSERRAMQGPPSEQKNAGRTTLIPKESRSFVTKMALLGAIDSFGASFHGSLLSYWFFVVHGASLAVLGPLFAVSNLIGSATMLVGAKLADKIGNVNATVLTHLPAPFLLVLLPFAPNFQWAAAIQIMRQAISRMDNPIKQSYMMSIVPRQERARARGFTMVFQRLPSSFSPSAAAYLMSAVSTSMPFYIGGFIQLCHDILYYFTFRHIKPPEERAGEGLELASTAEDD